MFGMCTVVSMHHKTEARPALMHFGTAWHHAHLYCNVRMCTDDPNMLCVTPTHIETDSRLWQAPLRNSAWAVALIGAYSWGGSKDTAAEACRAG